VSKQIDKIRRRHSYTTLSNKVKATSNVCYYCNKVLTLEEATVDHRTPLSRGGKHERKNLVVSCKECNNLKADMTEEEFTKSKKTYVPKEKPAYTDGYVHINEIHIPICFSQPKEAKMQKTLEFYYNFGTFNGEIILKSKKNKILMDGYTRYLASQILGIEILQVKYMN
jgi:hypothetical protein